ncbi:hypothetical protein OSTOST_14617 [Ostertagia ostertagi]
MILCNIESTILEEGEGDEVKMDSSVLCDTTTFNFLSTERDSKLRLSTKSEPFDLLLLGMKRNEKRIIRIDQKTAVLFHVKKVGTVCEVLNDYSVLHRIVGVEIDRMEIRLEAALERMVDRHFQSFAEEIRNVKSTQEAILNKLDELTKTRDS